jgi:hypothetical protein
MLQPTLLSVSVAGSLLTTLLSVQTSSQSDWTCLVQLIALLMALLHLFTFRLRSLLKVSFIDSYKTPPMLRVQAHGKAGVLLLHSPLLLPKSSPQGTSTRGVPQTSSLITDTGARSVETTQPPLALPPPGKCQMKSCRLPSRGMQPLTASGTLKCTG